MQASKWREDDWSTESQLFSVPRIVACGTRRLAPQVVSHCFSWTHAGSELRKDATHDDARVSPQFEALGQRWCIVLYPHHLDHETGRVVVSLFLRRVVVPPTSSSSPPLPSQHSIYFRISSPRRSGGGHSVAASHRFRIDYGWRTFLSHDEVLGEDGAFLHGTDEALKIQIQMTYHVPGVRADVLVERPLAYQRHALVVSCDQTAAALTASLASTSLAIPVKHQQIWVMNGHTPCVHIAPKQTLRSAWEQQGLEHAGVYTLFLRDTRHALASSTSASPSILLRVRWFDGASWVPLGSGEFAINLLVSSMVELLAEKVSVKGKGTNNNNNNNNNDVLHLGTTIEKPLVLDSTLEALGLVPGQELLFFSISSSTTLPPPPPPPPTLTNDFVEWIRFGSIEADLVYCEQCQYTFDEIEDVRDDLNDMPCTNTSCPHHQANASSSSLAGGDGGGGGGGGGGVDVRNADNLRDRLQTARLCRRRDKLLLQLESLETRMLHTRLSCLTGGGGGGGGAPTTTTKAAHSTNDLSVVDDALERKRAKRQRQKQARQQQQQQKQHLHVSINKDVTDKKPVAIATPSSEPVQKEEGEEEEDPVSCRPDSLVSGSGSASDASEVDDETFFQRISSQNNNNNNNKPASPEPVIGSKLQTVTKVNSSSSSHAVEPVAGFMGVFDAAVLDEIRQRALLGVSIGYESTLCALKSGSPVFCFEPRTRVLHGPFFTDGAADCNLDPRAFLTASGTRSRFPVQVRLAVQPVVQAAAVTPESRWQHLLRGPQRIRALRGFECARLVRAIAHASSSSLAPTPPPQPPAEPKEDEEETTNKSPESTLAPELAVVSASRPVIRETKKHKGPKQPNTDQVSSHVDADNEIKVHVPLEALTEAKPKFEAKSETEPEAKLEAEPEAKLEANPEVEAEPEAAQEKEAAKDEDGFDDYLLAISQLDLCCDDNQDLWSAGGSIELTPFVSLPFDIPASFLAWTCWPAAHNAARADMLAFLLEATRLGLVQGSSSDNRVDAHRIWSLLSGAPSLRPADLVEACRAHQQQPQPHGTAAVVVPFDLHVTDLHCIAQAHPDMRIVVPINNEPWSLFKGGDTI